MRWWLVLLGGCAQLPMAPDRVRLVNIEPTAACAAVEAVEIRSAPRECPTSEMLRAYARRLGADYVVLDGFTVLDDDEVVALGRLFACGARP